MPAAYAHYRFGQDVLSCLPQDKQASIQTHRALYDLGLHGPDLLFYYRPLSHDPLKHQGSAMHQAAAADFFRPAGELLRHEPADEALTICGAFFVTLRWICTATPILPPRQCRTGRAILRWKRTLTGRC